LKPKTSISSLQPRRQLSYLNHQKKLLFIVDKKVSSDVVMSGDE
jgi:hypothetical protein